MTLSPKASARSWRSLQGLPPLEELAATAATPSEFAFLALQATFIVAVAALSKSLAACAGAFVVAVLLQSHLIRWQKYQCVSVAWIVLFRHPQLSPKVTILLLLPALGVMGFWGPGTTTPMPHNVTTGAIAATLLPWLILISFARHSLASARSL